MKSKTTLFILQIITTTLFAQSWRSEYYPQNWTPPITKNFYTDAFLQDYSYAGYHNGDISLPNSSGTIYDVTKAPYNADKSGNTDATSAIQNAINTAQSAGGGVVYLPAGTYLLNPGANKNCLQINKSNIILKGDGVGKTFLKNTSYKMNDKAIISISGSASSSWTNIPTTKALLTKDVMNPISTLSVDNTSLFQVGDLVMVRNSITNEWITEHKEDQWIDAGSSLRGILFCRYITAIDATNKTITIDVPVRYALKTRDQACVYKLSGIISEVGLQDFSIANVQHPGTTGWAEEDYTSNTNASYDCAASYLIKYNTIVNGWIKNVETYQPTENTTKAHMLSNGILVQFSKNVTIDNCSINYAQYGGGGGNGYAYRVSANEVLISNSKASYIRHGFVFSSMWCSGNVFHNCKDIKTGFQTGNTGNMSTSGWGSDHHMHFSQSNLIDQCYSENSAFVAFYRPYGSTPKHNLTSTHTTFWNTTSAGTKGFCVWTQQSRYGYAIGTSGTSATIKTNENTSGSATKTNPIDISEGQGKGATLIPQSLYLDQLNRRQLPALKISTLQLIDASNETIINGFENLQSNTIIDKGSLSAKTFNIYAVPSSTVDSIVFLHTFLNNTVRKKEGASPFALRGDGSGYQTWNLPVGIHHIDVSAYYNGIESATTKITLTVTEFITSFSSNSANKRFTIYPNPTKEKITIVLSDPSNESIEILNSTNQLLIQKKIQNSNNTYEIDISKLNQGVYFIKIGNHIDRILKF